MPEPLKTLENQSGHRTKAERAARESAEEDLMRSGRVTIKPPAWLDDDAMAVFHDLRRKLKNLILLDNLDSVLLGVYCDALANYKRSSRLLTRTDENGLPMATDEQVKAAQAWGRLCLQYAEKLGLSPTARARLARRRAAPETNLEPIPPGGYRFEDLMSDEES